MNENIERVLDELDGFRMADEMTYAAYSRLHDSISELDDLLKAQEARVMKFNELEDTIADRAVWYEAFLTEVPTIAIVCEKSIADDAYTIFDFISGRHRVTRKTYGAAWRCWTARPTEEQRKAVKWDG